MGLNAGLNAGINAGLDARPETLHLVSRAPGVSSPTPRFLAVEAPVAPRFLTGEADGLARLEHKAPPAAGLTVQAIEYKGRPRLLLAQIGDTDTAPAVRVNGYPAPRIALLQAGDQLMIGGQLLQIGVRQAPPVALASEADVGKRCPFCTGKFESEDQLYRCACGFTVHHLSAPRGDGSVLECVTFLSECRGCGSAPVLDEGWSRVDPTL